MQSDIEIGRLHHHCRVWGAAQQAFEAERQLNRLSEEKLPSVLASKAEEQLGNLLSPQAVLRIRNMRLRLQINPKQLDTFLTADAWADQFLMAIKAAVSRGGQDIALFRNEADYSAAFVAALLKGQAWQDWRFEEFHSLHYLDEQEAATQHVLARLLHLPGLAASLEALHALQPFIERLTEQQAEMLCEHWVGQHPSQRFTTEAPPVLPTQILKSVIGKLESGTKRKHPSSRWVDTLLNVLADDPLFSSASEYSDELQLTSLCLLVAHVDTVRQYQAEITAMMSAKRSSSTSDEKSRASGYSEPQVLVNLRSWMKASSKNHTYLATLIDELQAEPIPVTPRQDSVHKSEGVAPSLQQMFVADAGVVLLVPVMLTLKLFAHYSTEALREALAMCVDASDDSLTWLDWILPEDEEALGEPNVLPAGWQLGLSASQQEVIAELRGTVQVSALLLAQFSARLSGLQQSSKAYLQKQFLQTPGTVTVKKGEIHVSLNAMPLLIVLQMSGICPSQHTLPWSDTLLCIEVKDG